jgi:hypothetical protein
MRVMYSHGRKERPVMTRKTADYVAVWCFHRTTGADQAMAQSLQFEVVYS